MQHVKHLLPGLSISYESHRGKDFANIQLICNSEVKEGDNWSRVYLDHKLSYCQLEFVAAELQQTLNTISKPAINLTAELFAVVVGRVVVQIAEYKSKTGSDPTRVFVGENLMQKFTNNSYAVTEPYTHTLCGLLVIEVKNQPDLIVVA